MNERQTQWLNRAALEHTAWTRFHCGDCETLLGTVFQMSEKSNEWHVLSAREVVCDRCAEGRFERWSERHYER